jgi:hypothetical protein
VNWRSTLGVLAGLLLPLPLILSLGTVRLLEPRVSGPEGKRISPVLTSEERALLVTYHRDCGLSSECEPPLGCLTETRARKQYCTDSECTTDAQCPEGQLCQHLATWGDGPLVRRCVPVGIRQQGEGCIKLPEDKGSACAPGLLCGSYEGWCSRPCRMGSVSDCPAGFFCADTIPEPVCLPTCEARGCPEGQHCILFDEGASVCAQVYGPQCQQTPCSHGHECDVSTKPQQPGKVWMECVERCGEGHPPCTAGLICDGLRCKPPCNPQDPDPCGEGYRCKERRPGRPSACYPDWTW